MPQSLACILVHVVFSTKNRQPLISSEIERELHLFTNGVLRDIECPALAVGGTEDHIHILTTLAKTVSISELVEEVKTRSSKWIKSKGPEFKRFYWQTGYGAFSIGRSQVDQVRAYVNTQKAHHKKRSFQDEFMELLKKYEIKYDKRYLWDEEHIG